MAALIRPRVYIYVYLIFNYHLPPPIHHNFITTTRKKFHPKINSLRFTGKNFLQLWRNTFKKKIYIFPSFPSVIFVEFLPMPFYLYHCLFFQFCFVMDALQQWVNTRRRDPSQWKSKYDGYISEPKWIVLY